MNKNNKRAAFFDRDGVVNVSPGDGYVSSWDEFEFTPGIIKLLAWCRERGFTTVLVTNQRGVFTGALTAESLASIHHQIQKKTGRTRRRLRCHLLRHRRP